MRAARFIFASAQFPFAALCLILILSFSGSAQAAGMSRRGLFRLFGSGICEAGLSQLQGPLNQLAKLGASDEQARLERQIRLLRSVRGIKAKFGDERGAFKALVRRAVSLHRTDKLPFLDIFKKLEGGLQTLLLASKAETVTGMGPSALESLKALVAQRVPSPIDLLGVWAKTPTGPVAVPEETAGAIPEGEKPSHPNQGVDATKPALGVSETERDGEKTPVPPVL